MDFTKIKEWPSREKLNQALQAALKIVDRNMVKFGENFPARCAVNGLYPVEGNVSWTTGFWTGMLWIAYELTNDVKYSDLAQKQIAGFYKRIEEKIEVNYHDMGFIYSPSCVASYMLTGNEQAKEAALLAADWLIKRFREKGEFLNAWADNDNVTAEANFYIIDCLLNIPLLYWAAKETGDDKYKVIAEKHLITTMNTIIREDGSTYHSFLFDLETGKPLKGRTQQGYSDDSTWSRGQAWGILGFALNYAETGNENDIKCFKRVTDYYLKRLPDDYIPYWDLSFTEGDEPRDSSAAAIAICGIMEMSKYLSDDDADKIRYQRLAGKMFHSLIDDYAVKPEQNIDGLLLRGTGSKPHDLGVDEPCNFGDYYYLEAIIRSLKDWNIYW